MPQLMLNCTPPEAGSAIRSFQAWVMSSVVTIAGLPEVAPEDASICFSTKAEARLPAAA